MESLLMQMTELGKEPEDLEARPDLDYEAEQNPVTLTEGSPEQAYTFLAEIHRRVGADIIGRCELADVK